MHVLYITNSYGGTEVYYNLLISLDNLGIQQTVFVPLNVNNHNRLGNLQIDFKVEGSKIVYSTALRAYHKYLYRHKIRTILNAIKKQIDMSNISLIHASSLCSDGAVAMELSKQYNIPYISAVRNTDINIYYKILIWQRGYYKKILLNASKIIFISPQYKKFFTEKIISNNIFLKIKDKIHTIPNAARDMFWENRRNNPNKIHNPVRIIFVGAFQLGKNLDKLILAIASLKEKSTQIELTAVGRGLANRKNDPGYIKNIENLALQYSWVKLLDSVSQTELIKLFSESDIFAMPSTPETFGLVYVEAMTQGLPIIYTKGQGFDGFYPEGEVGYGVVSSDIKDIADKIELIINSYNKIASNIANLDIKKDFSWDIIAEKYKDIYFEIINTKN
ncbi:MAG: glycosyltransferase family 4 protein [Bacteroidales bacterium]|nr:glycosyltransferase family 4 protein [Bacteroidales bacterium]